LQWGLELKLAGNTTISGMALDGIPGSPVTGSLDGDFSFHSSAPIGKDLLEPLAVSGTFTVTDGRIKNTGLVEVAMGTPIREVVFTIGGGAVNGNAIKAVQTGGPSGGCLPVDKFDLPVDFDVLYEAFFPIY